MANPASVVPNPILTPEAYLLPENDNGTGIRHEYVNGLVLRNDRIVDELSVPATNWLHRKAPGYQTIKRLKNAPRTFQGFFLIYPQRTACKHYGKT